MSLIAVLLSVFAISMLSGIQCCCQPDRYAVDFDMDLQIAGQMRAKLSGTSYADYLANNFYWSGSGDVHFSKLPNPVSMDLKMGIDSKQEVVWYALESPLFKRCEAYKLGGGVPRGMQCVFDLFMEMDDGSLISPRYMNYFENATVDDACIPVKSKVMLTEPIPAIINSDYGKSSFGDEVDSGLKGHEMPSDCTLAGKMKVGGTDENDDDDEDDESDLESLGQQKQKRSLTDQYSSPVYRRLVRRDIFDFATTYVNRALDTIKDGINNPDKVIAVAKKVINRGKEVAADAVDKIKETYENREEIMEKVKEGVRKGKVIGNKWKVAIEKAMDEE